MRFDFHPPAPLDHTGSFIWTLNLPIVLSVKVGELTLTLSSELPNVVRLTYQDSQQQEQEYSLNLSILDIDSGYPALKTYLAGTSVRINQLIPTLQQLRSHFENERSCTRIELVPPNLLSETRYRAIVTVHPDIQESDVRNTFGSDVKIRQLPDHRYEILGNSFKELAALANCIPKQELARYFNRFASTTGFVGCFADLESRGSDINYLTKSAIGTKSLWFTQCVDQLSPQEYLQFVKALKQYPNLTGQFNKQYLTQNVQPRLKALCDYHILVAERNDCKKILAGPLRYFLKKGFDNMHEGIPFAILCILVITLFFPLMAVAAVLKGIAKLLTLFTPNRTYTSPTYPSLMSKLEKGTWVEQKDSLQIGPIGAPFDFVANVLLNLTFIAAIPLLVLGFILVTGVTAISTLLTKGFRVRQLEKQVGELDQKIAGHKIFDVLHSVGNLRQVSKGMRNLLNKKINHGAVSEVAQAVVPPLTQTEIQENLAKFTQNPDIQFGFFANLPPDLKQKVVDHVLEDSMGLIPS